MVRSRVGYSCIFKLLFLLIKIRQSSCRPFEKNEEEKLDECLFQLAYHQFCDYFKSRTRLNLTFLVLSSNPFSY